MKTKVFSEIVSDFYKSAGPLAPLLVVTFVCLFLFFCNRIALGFYFSDSISEVDNFLFYLPVGVRTDLIIISLVLILPSVITLILPTQFNQVFKRVYILYIVLFCALFLILEIISWPFLEEYRSRPNQILFQYLTHPKEVLTMVWKNYDVALVLSLILLVYFVKYSFRFVNFLYSNESQWHYVKKIIALPVVVSLLVLGGRSGIGEVTPNPSISAFSNDFLTNQLALNASFSLSYAIYSSNKSGIRAAAQFGDMDREKIIARTKETMGLDEEDFISDEFPTQRRQLPLINRERPLNLVVIVMEGFGADRVGSLGGEDLSPNFDRLSGHGVFFTEMYANGTRTSRGLEGIIAGYPPTPGSSTIFRLDLAQIGFATITNLLKEKNYSTSFIYGGEANFDNMANFFLGNGFDEIIDGKEIESASFRGTWGVSDEDLFIKANSLFRESKNAPFASVLLTLSNHRPFDFPANKIQLVEQPQETPKNSHKYSDYALGKFFEIASQEEYYKDTVFLIVADHPMNLKGRGYFPVSDFKVPALIIGPGIEPQKIDKLSSHYDLPPTILSLLGPEFVHPYVGRNLLTIDDDLPGRSMMNFNDLMGYRVEDRIVVFQPSTKPKVFSINGHRLTEDDFDQKLVNDARAALLFPELAYKERLYQLR